MLQDKFRIILILVLIITVVIIITKIRRNKLDLRYTIPWIVLVAGLMGMTLFPRLLDWLSETLGIYSPVNMLFFMGVAFSLVIIFSLTMAISKMADEIKCLAQEVALLKAREKQGDEDVSA